MKLSVETLNYIQNVVNTADLVKIDSIIIEPNRVRAIDEHHSVFILQTTGVPVMEFGSIGLNRTNVFTSRFELGRAMTDFVVDAVVEGTDPMYARALTMKAKGIKVDYRCANPNLIKAPKILHDTLAYSIQINPDAVLMMQKGQAAMSADEVTFVGSDDGMVFEMADGNADKMNCLFTTIVTRVDGEDTPTAFVHTYALKILLPLFKINPTGYFFLTSQGMLKIVINGLDVYVLPRT